MCGPGFTEHILCRLRRVRACVGHCWSLCLSLVARRRQCIICGCTKCMWFWIVLHSFGLWSKTLGKFVENAKRFGCACVCGSMNAVELSRIAYAKQCTEVFAFNGYTLIAHLLAQTQINRWRSRELLYCAKAFCKSFIFYQFMCRVYCSPAMHVGFLRPHRMRHGCRLCRVCVFVTR